MAAPYPIVNDALNAARTRLLDIYGPGAGNWDVLNVVTNEVPLQIMTNSAFQRMQEFLVSLGFYRLEQETVITNIPPAVNTTDTASQCYLSWDGYFDGVNLNATPVLPQNMIAPLKLWERRSDTATAFTDMDQVLDGLPQIPPGYWNGAWEWRNDSIYIPGTGMPTDLRIRFASYLPDFETSGGVAWYNQPVPIMRSRDCLSLYICWEVAKGRGDAQADDFLQEAENAARIIAGLDTQEPKSIKKTSEYGRMKDAHTPEATN